MKRVRLQAVVDSLKQRGWTAEEFREAVLTPPAKKREESDCAPY